MGWCGVGGGDYESGEGDGINNGLSVEISSFADFGYLSIELVDVDLLRSVFWFEVG